jgi:ABC-2 type transport system ATP-binding protein
MATIEILHLSKRFGAVTAVDDLTFTLEPGTITGFLGRNGAGKTTTLRILLGLSTATSGSATIDGRSYRSLVRPIEHVGAVLETNGFHPGRRALDHLHTIADATGVPRDRCASVLDEVGLGGDGRRRVGGFSLGMRQRLGIAAALLGDPGVLILDEPTNGLDPEGVHWLRQLLRRAGDDGRTVLVSSHLLSEVALTVDDVVVIDDGRLVAHAPLGELPRLAGSTGLEDAFLRLTSRDRHHEAGARPCAR